MPILQEVRFTFFDDALDATDLIGTKSAAGLQSNGLQPEFRNSSVFLHVDMRWFYMIARIEKESVGA